MLSRSSEAVDWIVLMCLLLCRPFWRVQPRLASPWTLEGRLWAFLEPKSQWALTECFRWPHHLPVGHKCCSKGRESCGCEDHLHRAHGSSGGCLLASAPWVPLWVGCWWSETHDVSWIHLFLNILSKLYNIWLSILSFFFPPVFFLSLKLGYSFKQYFQTKPLSWCSHCWSELPFFQSL